MRSLASFVIVANVLAFTAFGISAVQAVEPRQAVDQQQTTLQNQVQWRYTFHNGEWWYWLPTNRWVYWRDSRWNDYTPRTYTLPRSPYIAATDRAGLSDGSQAANDSDIRPFYGRTVGDLDRRSTEPDGEIGPFYGNTLPSDILGSHGVHRDFRPFYGRAASANGD